MNEHTTPDKLERYAFLWSLIRMPIAAVALFLGGTPLVWEVFGYSSPLGQLLPLAWLISGIAVLYLLYLWNKNGKKIFGGTDQKDVIAFFVMVISGINLGLAGLSSTGNIGMNIFSDKLFFVIGGVIYLATTWHLYNRWKASGERIVSTADTATMQNEKAHSEDTDHQENQKKEESEVTEENKESSTS